MTTELRGSIPMEKNQPTTHMQSGLILIIVSVITGIFFLGISIMFGFENYKLGVAINQLDLIISNQTLDSHNMEKYQLKTAKNLEQNQLNLAQNQAELSKSQVKIESELNKINYSANVAAKKADAAAKAASFAANTEAEASRYIIQNHK